MILQCQSICTKEPIRSLAIFSLFYNLGYVYSSKCNRYIGSVTDMQEV